MKREMIVCHRKCNVSSKDESKGEEMDEREIAWWCKYEWNVFHELLEHLEDKCVLRMVGSRSIQLNGAKGKKSERCVGEFGYQISSR